MAQRRMKGIAIHRPIVYGNTAQFLLPSERSVADHTHKWTVAVRSAASPPPGKRGDVQQIGGLDDISYYIKKVSFKLHETYPNPTRVIDKPPFEVTETGWGEFEIQIKIFFVQEANEKILTVQHLLKLHPWTVKNNLVVPAPDAAPSTDPMNAPPVHSWQYDEIVFNDPTEALYNIMTQSGATPLPPVPRPNHSIGPVAISPHNGGAFGEFSADTEKQEYDRLDKARNTVVEELESWRAKLIQYESEIKSLRKDIEGS